MDKSKVTAILKDFKDWAEILLSLVYPVFAGMLLGIILVPLFLIILIGLKLLFVLLF